MKNLFLILILLLSSVSFGQETRQKMQTLIKNNGRTHHGFYLGLDLRATNFGNDTSFMTGIKAAWIINRSVGLGVAGYGLVPSITKDNIVEGEDVRPLMGYGGFMIEPVIRSNKLIHFTTPIILGAGWAGYIYDWEQDNNNGLDDRGDLIDDEVFWVIEPGVSGELNVAKFFRLNLGVSYRFTQDINLLNTSENALKGMNYSLTLKFGRF